MKKIATCLIAGLLAMSVYDIAAAAEPMDLIAAIQQGKIQAEFYGNGDQSVRGRIRTRPFGPDEVYVQPGTQFWAQQEGLQGMTTVGWVPIDLRNRRFVFVDIPTACTNYNLPAPTRWTRMIPHPCPSPAMAALTETAGTLKPRQAVIQLAVWAIANNPSWEKIVGLAEARAEGDTDEERAADALVMRRQAAELLAAAGVAPEQFRMFVTAAGEQ
ncbi:MAG: hypothetical protein J7M38_10330 [Armatimonadetes bacterium]|nr:hypothetical protein [Armatimonadota bacterium]